ncbi:MAG: protein kinase domain-containing protein, partial [bacterium]
MPPECFQLSSFPPLISTKVDIWSLGVIFFEMLYSQRPFGHNMSQNQVIQDQIILKSKQVEFPERPAVSKEAQEFIRM